MKKKLLLILLVIFTILLVGCEETVASKQVVTSNSVEINSGNLLESQAVPYDEVNIKETETKTESYESQLSTSEVIVKEVEGAIYGNEEEQHMVESTAEEPVDSEPTYEEIVVGEVAVDSIITFGRYEQDNNLDNGPEPIEWRVFEISEGKATLIPVKCLMWGLGVECDEKIEDFTAVAFNDYERKCIAEEPILMTKEFISKELTCKSASKDGSAVYKKDSRFEFMKNYSESVLEQGAKPIYVRSGNIEINHYMIWTYDYTASWSDSNDELNNSIGIHQIYKRKSSSYKPFGICPYLVIYTDNAQKSIEE